MSIDISNLLANTDLLLEHFPKEKWQERASAWRGQNIFFGMGIMTHQAVSVAVPFDILSMFLIAETLRQLVSAKQVFVLVADQHAITNQLLPSALITDTTKHTLATVHQIIHNFKLSHFRVIQTVTLNDNADIRAIYRSLPAMQNDYLKHEIADTLWLKAFHQVGIKLGWAMSSTKTVEGHDERFFDTQISQFCPNVHFVHIKPGRTADPLRQRVSPYVSTANEQRLLITEQELVSEKLTSWRNEKNNPAIKPLLRHLSQLARIFQKLFAQPPQPFEKTLADMMSIALSQAQLFHH